MAAKADCLLSTILMMCVICTVSDLSYMAFLNYSFVPVTHNVTIPDDKYQAPGLARTLLFFTRNHPFRGEWAEKCFFASACGWPWSPSSTGEVTVPTDSSFLNMTAEAQVATNKAQRKSKESEKQSQSREKLLNSSKIICSCCRFKNSFPTWEVG